MPVFTSSRSSRGTTLRLLASIGTTLAVLIGSSVLLSTHAANAETRAAIRINVAGVRATDANGAIWRGDNAECNGEKYDAVGHQIRNTADQVLFQTKRYGLTKCTVSAPSGSWTLRLLFTETYFKQAAKRVFSVKAEGQSLLNNLDVWRAAGGTDVAYASENTIEIKDGKLDLTFSARTNQAILSGIELVPRESGASSSTTSTTVTTTTRPTSTTQSAPTTTVVSTTSAPSTAPTTSTAPVTTTPVTTTPTPTTIAATTTSSTTTTTTSTTTPPSPTTNRFRGKLNWQIQFSGTIDTTVNADVFDLDLFETSDATLNALRAKGKTLICYFSAGTWEPYRSDKDAFPNSVIGATVDGWPDEKWLDVRRLDVLEPIMARRLDLCKARGFVAADADNVDGYTNNPGFAFTAADQLNYNTMLARLAHERGLLIGLKNDLNQIVQLEPVFDFAINESCLRYDECSILQPFVAAGKSVLHIEYSGSFPGICSNSSIGGFSTLKKAQSLSAARQAC